MTKLLAFLIKIYGLLIRLFPPNFRAEFEDQILQDFSDLMNDAHRKGKYPLLQFCVRELINLPINLLHIHLKESSMITALRSQPANLGLRGALVFGLSLGFMILANGVALSIEPRVEYWMSGWLQGLSIRPLLDWTGFVLIGLIFGCLFAVLFGDRSQYLHYMLVGTFGWLLQLCVYNYLEYFFNFRVLLSAQENLYLTNLKIILSGAMFGLIFTLPHSERREVLRTLVIYVAAYPMLTYFYVSMIVNSSISNTALRLAPLAILWLALLGGIFAFAWKYNSNPEMVLLLIAGAMGSIVLKFVVLLVAFLFIPPVPPEGFLYDHPSFWSVVLILTAAHTIFGVLFGFLLGWILGIQKENPLQPVAA
ncbi:MAG TPA: hypothetical protein VFG81_14415 [Anaerolineales bacterium]|jgi:hypothetical protein|nr:hypothetical protein [Anaerolineales bacterium]